MPATTVRKRLDLLASVRRGEGFRADIAGRGRPVTPVVRVDAMEQRLDTMLRAINIVQPALQKFYGSLTDEQKERFNRLASVQG
jgi:LTXXQ motif family protein